MRRLCHLLLCSLCSLLWVPGVADAGETESATAAAHNRFQAAHRDFEAGDYESALKKYKAAYDLQPHPNILYNLALTYERLLEYDEAIATFQRFLDQPPAPDPRGTESSLRLFAERSLRRLRGLPARISVSALPEHAEVSAAPVLQGGEPGPPAWQGRTPAVFKVPAGRYLLRYVVPGYLPEEVVIDAHVGQALLVQRQLQKKRRLLSVDALPRARLYLDDRPLGATPYQGLVDTGSHRLRLERLFYLTHVRQFDVLPGERPLTYRTQLVQSGLQEMLIGGLLAGAGLGLVALRVITGTEVENTTAGELYKPLIAAIVPGVVGAGIVALVAGSNIPASQVQLMMGNTAWGTLIGFGLGLGTVPGGLLPHTLAAAGGFLGGMASLGINRWRHLDSGTVALYNSGALWGSTFGGLIWAYLVTQNPDNAFIGHTAAMRIGDGGWALFGSTAAGIGIGVVLANLPPLRGLSRQHVALVDLGGAIGGLGAGLTGLGIAYGVTSSWPTTGKVAVPLSLGGAVAGLITAAVLTRNLRADRELPSAGALIGFNGRGWQLQGPSLSVALQASSAQADLTMLKGVW